MKVFLDANVIISVLNKEYPVFTYSSRILSLSGNPKYSLYTSPLCLAIAFYFSSKKSGTAIAKRKMSILSAHLGITTVDESVVKASLNNLNIHDFEDGIEYYSAENASCKVIITENQEDFYFGKLEVLNCKAFINHYCHCA